MRTLIMMVMVILMAMPVTAGTLLTIPTDGNGNPGNCVFDSATQAWVAVKGDSTGAMVITGNITASYTAPANQPVTVIGDTFARLTYTDSITARASVYGGVTAVTAGPPSGDSISPSSYNGLYTLGFQYGYNYTTNKWDRIRVAGVTDNCIADTIGVMYTNNFAMTWDAAMSKWNKTRGDTTYGIDVDITRMPAVTVTVPDTAFSGITFSPNSRIYGENSLTRSVVDTTWQTVAVDTATGAMVTRVSNTVAVSGTFYQATQPVSVAALSTMTCTTIVIDSTVQTITLDTTYREIRLFCDTVCVVTFNSEANPSATFGDIIADDWIPYVDVVISSIKVTTYYTVTGASGTARIRVRGMR